MNKLGEPFHNFRSCPYGHRIMEELRVSSRSRKPDRNGSTELRSRPPRHGNDLIGQQQGFIEIVRDHDRSGRVPRFRTQLHEHLLQRCPRQRIERAERFVEEQKSRFCRKRARDRDTLPHAARKLAGTLLQSSPETHGFEITLGLFNLARSLPVRKRGLNREPDVFQCGKPGQQGVVLKDDRGMGVNASNALTPNGHRAGVGRQESGKNTDQCGFAGTRGPDDRNEFSFFDRKADTAQDVSNLSRLKQRTSIHFELQQMPMSVLLAGVFD